MVLKAYELALRPHPRKDPRHRIEHCTLVNPDLLKRIAALGVIPTPFYTYVYYHGDKWAQYGEERPRWMFAHRSFLDHGIRVAGASDYVPGPFEPLMAIQSMVTRKDYRGRVWGENQKITRGRSAAHLHAARRATPRSRSSIKGSITRRQAGRLRHAGRRPAHGRSGPDQGHPGRAHRGRRRNRLFGVIVILTTFSRDP